MQGEMIMGVLVTRVDGVTTFRGLMISLLLLRANRLLTQTHFVTLQLFVAAIQGHPALRLFDYDLVGKKLFRRLSGCRQGEKHQEQDQDFLKGLLHEDVSLKSK